MNKKSGHWQNTGLAKWISDNLYQYNTSDEKSMNPMKWYSIQNGGNLNDTRETINGFPCRLILINDGETPLNEGQNEPTPGNVKDMGIFNFNNDKGNTDTLGLDNEIFPRCVSYEVASNSDTSAGAFVPYKVTEYNVGKISSNHTTLIPASLFNGKLVFHKYHENTSNIGYYQYEQSGNIIKYNDFANFEEEILIENNAKYVRFVYKNVTVSGTKTYKVNEYTFYETLGQLNNQNNSDTPICEPIVTEDSELAYLQDSFELRYPDDKEVGADYGFLGMNVHVKNMFIDYVPIDVYQIYTTAVTPDYYGSEITVETDNGRYFKLRYYYPNDWDTETSSYDSGSTVTLKANRYVSIVCSPSTKYLIINGTKYTIGNETTMSEIRKNPYEGDGEEIVFSSEYGLKRLVDWVGNSTDEEFVAEFENYFNKEYTFRYYLLVIALGMVDNLGGRSCRV